MTAATDWPPLTLPEAFWDEVRARYATPPRAYHSFAHVGRVLEHAAEIGWAAPREVFLAIVFHDAIYVAGARDNEARSAELAREAIGRWLPDAGVDADRVAHLIELTARHGGLSPDDLAGDADAAQFLDCDMAVVAAPDDEFDAYDAGVAAEYASVVAPDAYRAGRRAFLAGLLAKDRIFLSARFDQRLDAAARANLRRALARL